MTTPPSDKPPPNPPPTFDAHFRDQFKTLIAWRRDVRRFTTRPVPPARPPRP